MDKLGRSSFAPAAAVTLCGAIWGCYWLPLRWFQAEGTGSAWVSIVFNGLSLVVLLPWMIPAKSRSGLGSQVVTGILIGSAFSLYTASLVLTDVLHAIPLFYLTPVWSTLAGWLFLGERLSLSRLLAIGLGLAGLASILGVTDGLPRPRNAGDWIALASGMLWSAGTLRSYVRPHAGVVSPVFAFSLGGLLSSILILAAGAHLSLPLADTANLDRTLPWIVLAAAIIFIPPNFLVLWAAQRIDPGRIGILLMTEVLIGSITAAALSGEALGLPEILGTALIIAAGAIEVLARR